MIGKTEQLVGRLAAGVDMDRVLEDLQLTMAQAENLLRARAGRRIMATRRRLAKIHADIVACRFSSYAVHRICELLSSEKPELRLKGSLSVLEIARLDKPRGRGKAKKTQPAEATPEDLVLLEMMARLLNGAEEEPLEALARALPAAVAKKNVDNGARGK